MSDVELAVVGEIAAIGRDDWNACACPEMADGPPIDPFTTYEFLAALETSGSVGQGTGWVPRYVIARQGGQVIAVMPSYAKGHSQGEYIFDHNWGHALEAAGGRYYPKLQTAVPFTPVTGRRFLCRAGYQEIGQIALIQGAKAVVEQQGWSSFHATFCTEAEYNMAPNAGVLQRIGQQFHWHNAGYQDFDGFLAALSSRKRKNIRKERIAAQGFGGDIVTLCGAEILPEHWDAFWHFYQDTGARKWGTPYLTREFFTQVHAALGDQVVLFLCRRGDKWVAGALNFVGRDTLFGRYWGCSEHHPCLHFELCYYRAIDFAIAHGLSRVEAGAQGEHKLARGYLPSPVYSVHWMADAGFGSAVEHYLEAERDAVGEDIEVMTSYGPFRRDTGAIAETE
ncbi:hypothetical protein GCM10007939_19740 [Amylibacter marinus]|uniref:N-acetyltransferase domain-containing protein n=1 Tax=Amylibacter marinus TaxID=1475483 RepID=A0ABQ5VWT2_9RHOB|nr:GNAT family N-acetyltransferase [Amylibacter marinus]GLQ35691.1 hypothetical protein GCM10007939_19740 [Amylibacter marinus]